MYGVAHSSGSASKRKQETSRRDESSCNKHRGLASTAKKMAEYSKAVSRGCVKGLRRITYR